MPRTSPMMNPLRCRSVEDAEWESRPRNMARADSDLPADGRLEFWNPL